MYCKHGGLRRQRTEDQAFISLHLQADQISKIFNTNVVSLTLDGGRYHIETSPLICSVNQWTGFYMITASVMKGLK